MHLNGGSVKISVTRVYAFCFNLKPWSGFIHIWSAPPWFEICIIFTRSTIKKGQCYEKESSLVFNNILRIQIAYICKQAPWLIKIVYEWIPHNSLPHSHPAPPPPPFTTTPQPADQCPPHHGLPAVASQTSNPPPPPPAIAYHTHTHYRVAALVVEQGKHNDFDL